MSQYNLESYELKAELCKAFSDPNRLIIINELSGGEKSVGELAQALQKPQAIASRYLAILRNRGVVTSRREGITIYYRLTDLKIVEAYDIIHQVLLDVLRGNLEKRRELAEKLLTNSRKYYPMVARIKEFGYISC